jgi:manganese/iron transport system permease protein
VTGLGFAGGVRRAGSDVATALGLVGMLALGIVLASDVYESGSGVDRLLFGSLLAVSDLDLWLTAVVAVLAVGANAALRRTWLMAGFDGTGGGDRVLLGLVAAAVVVALSAVGALLVTAALVVPAATVRLLTDRLGALQAGAVALAAAEGAGALALARALNVGPGAALAVVASGCFALVAVVRR